VTFAVLQKSDESAFTTTPPRSGQKLLQDVTTSIHF